MFGRGACKVETQQDGSAKRLPFPSEFFWEGADGSRLLAIHMTHWYNNAQRFSADPNKAEKLANSIENSFEGIAATPYLLLMNGVDHLEAQDDILSVLKELRSRGIKIQQMRMDEYISAVKKYIYEESIPLEEHRGELRSGNDGDILKGTLSSRIYLKQWNVLLQDRLEHQLEPLYSMLALTAGEKAYPQQQFRYMWKELIKNHPHDSICGCSRDEVHKHMEDNFERLDEMSRDMLRRGMQLAAEHIALVDDNTDNYGILIANPTTEKRSDIVRITIDFPQSEACEGFILLDPNGQEVPFHVLSRREALHDVFSPLNLPGNIPVDRYDIEFSVKDMPGLCFRAYTIIKSPVSCAISAVTEREVSAAVLENKYLRITVDQNGQVDVLHKSSNRFLQDCLDWEDTADRGDSYIYRGGGHSALYGHQFPAELTMYADPMKPSVRIRRVMRLPVAYDFQARQRSAETVECPVMLTLSLGDDSPVAELSYVIENHAADHRLRLLVRTEAIADQSAADVPFDVLWHTDAEHYPDTDSKVLPNTSFAALETASGGTAVLTTGQHEYEHKDNLLAITVLRATGVINRDPVTLNPTGGEQWDCPANQCLRTLSGRMGLYLFEGKLLQSVLQEALKFRTPLASLFFAADSHKLAGGRPAVQDTTIAEYYYLPDPFPALRLQSDKPIIELDMDPGVIMTAFKLANCRGGCVLRLLNLNESDAAASVNADGMISRTTLSEETDTPTSDKRFTLGKKKLVTLRIQ